MLVIKIVKTIYRKFSNGRFTSCFNFYVDPMRSLKVKKNIKHMKLKGKHKIKMTRKKCLQIVTRKSTSAVEHFSYERHRVQEKLKFIDQSD